MLMPRFTFMPKASEAEQSLAQGGRQANYLDIKHNAIAIAWT
jgi:hypothetical protein